MIERRKQSERSIKNSTLEQGNNSRLGAYWDGRGVNFSLFSANAEKVELCLFSRDGKKELKRLTLPQQSNQIWHGYLPDSAPGEVYAYRVYGPYEPEKGHRFNHHKLLLDPYAKELIGNFRWSRKHYAYNLRSKQQDLSFNSQNNAAHMPKCVVINERPGIAMPKTLVPNHKTIIYETHLKGFTIRHPGIPEDQQGTFKGMAHDKVIEYLKALGITSIELLPVQGFLDESFLTEKGLSNYWGYNSLNFFAPHRAYQATSNIYECREMVEKLHDAGIEVILDVVFNHTAEGGRLGPTLSFRGIDNLSYYRLDSENKQHYINDTGCGNTLNINHPQVLRMVMDCLRYWVSVMKVDGFRFDLATILGREDYGFDRGSGFFDVLSQDPLLSTIKLIAEPWDIGPGGYQLGNFPPQWSEWNDAYRDTVRKFWRGDEGILPQLARRLHGSSDIFEHSGRSSSASINFITSHDGFTLNDLVSFNERHNELNQEDNRDGHSDNISNNYGVEGATDNEEIIQVRNRQRKNFLTTLFISQGTPMITAGDEFGRSLQGNNNAYCQDNELNWLDWSSIQGDNLDLLSFTQNLISLKKKYTALTQIKYIHQPAQVKDPAFFWLSPKGEYMLNEHWADLQLKTFGLMLTIYSELKKCREVFLVLFNASHEQQEFILPDVDGTEEWLLLLDTTLADGLPSKEAKSITKSHIMFSYSTKILFKESPLTQRLTDNYYEFFKREII